MYIHIYIYKYVCRADKFPGVGAAGDWSDTDKPLFPAEKKFNESQYAPLPHSFPNPI